jgi:hypothetical protein
MTTFIPTMVLLLSLAGGYGEAEMSTGSATVAYGGPHPWRAEFQPGSDAEDRVLELQATVSGIIQRDRTLQTVFVVPGPNLAPEGIAQISEDLAVMCRIFNKATIWADRMGPGEISKTIPVDVSGVEISQPRILTQGLYLDGYGAIFFLPVDFPLAPPQEQAASNAEPSGDPLWSQTANELRGAPPQSLRPSTSQYNAQKVENLKTALIGTLRHAANLRTRRAEDAITIVIATRLGQADRRELIFAPNNPYGDMYSQQQTLAPADSSPDVPTMLILRTTKSDVDALAQGGLSQEQFAQRVRLLKSWTHLSPEATSIGGPRSRLSAPLQNR